MPLSSTGLKILARMIQQYGKTKGRRVFYALESAGKLTPKAFKRKRKSRRS